MLVGIRKARSTYDWFFDHAKWDEEEVAQRKADMFFDHSKGYIWGNAFVTSVLQCRGLFLPHKAKMYIKEEDASSDGLKLRTKPQIAFEDIIKPLRIPEGTKLMIVFDSWWFSANLINKARGLGYHITCQIKSDKKVIPEDGFSLPVQEYASGFKKDDYNKVKITVRGKKKRYSSCRGQTHHLKKAEEILSIYEDRWNIETGHRESNQKLGFKEYQMHDKKAIELFIQLVFSVWTALLLMELKRRGRRG